MAVARVVDGKYADGQADENIILWRFEPPAEVYVSVSESSRFL
jgi:hypothetical protein